MNLVFTEYISNTESTYNKIPAGNKDCSANKAMLNEWERFPQRHRKIVINISRQTKHTRNTNNETHRVSL